MSNVTHVSKNKSQISIKDSAYILYKQFQQKRKDDRDVNLAGMILSLSNNNSNAWEKPEELFDICIESKDNVFGKSYNDTLKNSKDCMMNQEKLRKNLMELRENNPSSALIVPLLGIGHLWSTVIRKTDEGFNAVVINKGLRFFHDPIEEFVFNKEIKNGSDGLQRLMGCLKSAKKPPMLGMLPPPKSIDFVYSNFIKYSDKKFNVDLTVEDQKVGNCFTINLFTGIKFYQATMDLPHQLWKEGRNKENYTEFGTAREGKKEINWKNQSTEHIKRSIINDIATRNPRVASKVFTLWDIYLANRALRDDISNGRSLLLSMEKNFNPMGKNQDINLENRLEMYCSLLSPHNYRKNYKALLELATNHGSQELANNLRKMNDYFELTDLYAKVSYLSFYFGTKIDPVKSIFQIFDRDGKKTSAMNNEQKLDFVLDKLHPLALRKYYSQFVYLATKLNPDKDVNAALDKIKPVILAKESDPRTYENNIRQAIKELNLNSAIARIDRQIVQAERKFRVYDGQIENLIYDLPEIKKKFPLIAKSLSGAAGTFLSLAGMVANLNKEEIMRDVLKLITEDNFEKLLNRVADPEKLMPNIKLAVNYVDQQQKDYDTGRRYSDISHRMEDNKLIHIMHTVEFLMQKNYVKALSELGKAIISDPDDAELYMFRAETYHIMGNHELANKDSDMARKIVEKSAKSMADYSKGNHKTTPRMIEIER